MFTFVWLCVQCIKDLSNGKRELICKVLKSKFNRIGENWTAGQLDNWILSQDWAFDPLLWLSERHVRFKQFLSTLL